MKKIKHFNFRPDDHYGYPEINEISDSFIFGLSHNDLLDFYAKADCSAFAMEGGNPYEMSSVFSVYGNYDIYGYGYVCISDIDDETLDELIRQSSEGMEDLIMNGEIKGCSEVFMKELTENDEIDVLFAFPSTSNDTQEFVIYKDGNRISDSEYSSTLSTSVLPKVSDIIIEKFKNTSTRIQAAKIYHVIYKIFPNINDLLSKSLTPEEILSLRNIGKGSGMLSRFGRR
jgi:hypothetical protein